MIRNNMTETRIEIAPKTIINTFLFLLGIWAFYQIRSIVVLVFISYILMTAINPVVKLAQKKKIPILPVMFVIYLLVIGLISLVVASLIPALVDQSKALFTNLPNYVASLEENYSIHLDSSVSNGYLASIPSNIFKFAAGAFSNILNIMAVFFITYYLTLERPYLHKYLLHLFKDGKKEEKAEELVKAVEGKVGGWVRGEIFLMGIIGVMTYFGLLLLGIPYALPLAVLAGILELVPNIGPIIAAIPAILIGLTISPVVAVGATILSTLIQQLENNLIVPKIMESATGIKPLITILILLIGYQLGGIAGAILSMPLYLTASTVYTHINNQ